MRVRSVFFHSRLSSMMESSQTSALLSSINDMVGGWHGAHIDEMYAFNMFFDQTLMMDKDRDNKYAKRFP